MLVDEGHGFFAEVAAFGDGPLVVLFEEDGSDEADHGGVVGEDPDHVRASLYLLVDPLERVRGRDLAPVRRGNAAYAVTSLSAVARISAAFGKRSASIATTAWSWARVAAASGWAWIVRTVAATMSL